VRVAVLSLLIALHNCDFKTKRVNERPSFRPKVHKCWVVSNASDLDRRTMETEIRAEQLSSRSIHMKPLGGIKKTKKNILSMQPTMFK